MRHLLRWIRWTVALLIGLPLLLIAAVLIAANTEPGRRLIEREVGTLSGGEVMLAGLSGRFPYQLRVTRTEVRDKDGAWLAIENLAIDWQPWRLVMREAWFDEITAGHVAVARLPVSSGKSSSQSSYGLPVSVTLKELRVTRLDLAPPVAGMAAALSLDGSAHLASLQQGDATLSAQRLDGAGTYSAKGRIDPASLQAELAVHEPEHGLVSGIAGLPALGALRIDAGLRGPRDAVATKLAVAAGPLQAHADGTLDLVHEAANLSVTASAPAMSPRPDLSWQSVALDARVVGPFTKPQANGTLDIETLNAAGISLRKLAAQVEGNAGQVRLHAQADGIRVPGPRPDLLEAAPLLADATIQLDATDRPVSFKLQHPLIAAEGTAHTAGAMSAALSLDLPDLGPFAAAAGTDLRGHTSLKLAGAEQGGMTNITADGTLAITGGMAPLPGLIGDAGTIGVTAALRGQDIALSRLDLNGKTLSLSASGGLQNNVIDLNWRTALADLGGVA
ncbi:MAG: hypothetical protein JOZ58_27775, partial [Acetobacteraceae bacterium]|nr:hypothetical protein [Acetobacteraceae bacterium]